MRKILLFMFLPFSLHSQTTEKSEKLIDTSYESIQATFKEAVDWCNEIEGKNVVCPDKLTAAILLNVFKYYDLEDIYPSALKKATYMETQDYKDKLGELKLIKADYLSNYLYIEVNKNDNFEIGDYELNKGCFNVSLGGDYRDNDAGSYIIHSYLFRQLPIRNNIFFFPINKEKALEIENSIKNDIKLILLFKPTSVNMVSLDYFDKQIITDKVTVLILNSTTSEIYYNKNFSVLREMKKRK